MENYSSDYIIEYIVRLIGWLLNHRSQCRYSPVFLQGSVSWTDELASLTFIWYCFLGSVLTMHKKMHLGIDYFESKMKQRGRFVNRVFVYAVQIFFALLLAYYGFKLLGIVGRQKSPIMRVQMKYIYSVLPISGVLYLILSVHEMIMHVTHKQGPVILPAASLTGDVQV